FVTSIGTLQGDHWPSAQGRARKEVLGGRRIVPEKCAENLAVVRGRWGRI
ncbi:hypothetical protein P879_11794, partial [Paragonimus westermani]